jgi:HTH-type transcriptional regulator / antitoxin HigA
MVQAYENIIKTWPIISPILAPAKNETDIDRLIEFSDYIMEQINDNNHPLTGLIDIIGTLISDYESKNIPEPIGSPIGCLKYLMQEHGLREEDLTELGSSSIISEILSEKRELNKNQIKALSQRFGCNPAIFI